jgi:hypothetical protein
MEPQRPLLELITRSRISPQGRETDKAALWRAEWNCKLKSLEKLFMEQNQQPDNLITLFKVMSIIL